MPLWLKRLKASHLPSHPVLLPSSQARPPDQRLSLNLDYSAAKPPVTHTPPPPAPSAPLSHRTTLAEAVPRAPRAAAAVPGILLLTGFWAQRHSPPRAPQAARGLPRPPRSRWAPSSREKGVRECGRASSPRRSCFSLTTAASWFSSARFLRLPAGFPLLQRPRSFKKWESWPVPTTKQKPTNQTTPKPAVLGACSTERGR